MTASSTNRGAPRDITGRRAPSGRRHPKRGAEVAGAGARPAGLLCLDTAAVADVVGIDQEVALLRAAIRQLIKNDDKPRVDEARDDEARDGKTRVDEAEVEALAELRRQVDSLCTALKTQRALDGRAKDAVTAAVAQALERIGDEMGVPN